jgi:hypothetical protein
MVMRFFETPKKKKEEKLLTDTFLFEKFVLIK